MLASESMRDLPSKKGMAMPITSRDVARLAGVSQPTVSRALRDDSRVAPATRARVRQAVAALGYVPHEGGRSLVTRRTGRIGVVVNNLDNLFYVRLISAVHKALDSRGFRMMVYTDAFDNVSVEQLADGSTDGVVLMNSTLGSSFPVDLYRRGISFVFLSREGAQGLGDATILDNQEGGRLAAQHLVELGHRRIAGVFGPADTNTGRDRETGVRLELANSALSMPDNLIWRGPFEFETGWQAAQEILQLDEPPTAIVAGNDVIAIGVLNAAIAAHVDVPGRISVLGFDDIPMASWEAFQLSTIGHDLQSMANVAVELLIDRVEGSAGPLRRVVLPPRLIARSTTAPSCG